MDGASIYILRCADGSYYTGITRRSVEQRVSEHVLGLDAACYTFRRRPLTLVHSEHHGRIADGASDQGLVASQKGSLYERRLCGPCVARETRAEVGRLTRAIWSVLRGRFAAPQDEGGGRRLSKQKVLRRHRQLLRRLADQKLAVGLHVVSLAVDLDLRRGDPWRIMLDFRDGVERKRGASKAKVAQYLDKIRNA